MSSSSSFSDDEIVVRRKKITRKRSRPAATATATATATRPQVVQVQQQQLPPLVVLQFQDDRTGRKLVHPSALRYSLKLVEEEAQLTTKSVSRSLLQSGEVVSVSESVVAE